MTFRMLDMPEDQYHADPCDKPSLSASMCKVLVQETPMHAYLRHPKFGGASKAVTVEDKPEFKFDKGKASHAYLLDGANRMVIVDEKDWRKDVAKNQREEAHRNGMYALLRHQYNDVVLMARAAKEYINRNEDFGLNITDGYAEQTIIWDEDTPFPRRSRLDWISKDGRTILDFKTTDISLRYSNIRRHIEDMGYDIQDSFYKEAGNQLDLRKKPPRLIFLFQEAKAPYLCQMYSLEPGFVMLGQQKKEYAEELWKQCITTGKWTGYLDRVLSLEPSPWSHANWDERMELEGMTAEEAHEIRNPVVNGQETTMDKWLEA